MRRQVVAIAVSVLALGVTAATGTAVGMTVTVPAVAKAVTRTPIRTYTAQTSVYTKGIGSQKGWFTSQAYTEGVILAPHVAFREKTIFDYGWNDHHRSTQLYYIVGNYSYTKNGSAPWSLLRLSNSALRGAAQLLNPYQIQKELVTLTGVRHPSGSHYQLTSSYAQVGSFLQSAFSLTKAGFGGTNLKVFTINLWDDSSGRPVKITVTASSSTFAFTVTQTLTSYNKPLIITAP